MSRLSAAARLPLGQTGGPITSYSNATPSGLFSANQFEGERTMTISMLDQMLFPLSCKHTVVLGRLENKPNWTCEECGQETDLSSGQFRDLLKKDLDTAHQADLLEKAKGRTIERLG